MLFNDEIAHEFSHFQWGRATHVDGVVGFVVVVDENNGFFGPH